MGFKIPFTSESESTQVAYMQLSMNTVVGYILPVGDASVPCDSKNLGLNLWFGMQHIYILQKFHQVFQGLHQKSSRTYCATIYGISHSTQTSFHNFFDNCHMATFLLFLCVVFIMSTMEATVRNWHWYLILDLSFYLVGSPLHQIKLNLRANDWLPILKKIYFTSVYRL